MKTVRPKPLGARSSSLPLTPEEYFVLSRIDGRLSVRDLVALTGIAEQRVEQIVAKLASHGAVMLENTASIPDSGPPTSSRMPISGHHARAPVSRSTPAAPEGTTSFADFAAVLGLAPSPAQPDAAPDARGSAAQFGPEERVESRSNYPPPATSEPAEPMIPDVLAAADSEPELPPASPHTSEAAETGDADGAGLEETAAANERQYRQIYETRFHTIPLDARIHAGKTAHGADLMALCLDADPRVIAAILENPTTGLDHIRLVAFHHRTGTGLEMISRRSDFVRDTLVERRLLRNPQAGEAVLSRIFASKRVFQTYKIAIDREVPELTRVKGRGFVRQKFQSAPPEDRADFVLRTEGRCLVMMTGCTFDAKTTSILCSRAYNSVLFIQNLAKFGATPPMLLAHLMKQPFVRKSAPLKKLLLQHPNMPGDVKRQQ